MQSELPPNIKEQTILHYYYITIGGVPLITTPYDSFTHSSQVFQQVQYVLIYMQQN